MVNEKKPAASQTDIAESDWVTEVLQFWFEELSSTDWFAKSDGIDAKIRARFLALHEQLSGTDAGGISSPREMLAAIVVLDQFSRNLFRGSPQAFAADPIARRLARLAIGQGFDKIMKNENEKLTIQIEELSSDLKLVRNNIRKSGKDVGINSNLDNLAMP